MTAKSGASHVRRKRKRSQEQALLVAAAARYHLAEAALLGKLVEIWRRQPTYQGSPRRAAWAELVDLVEKANHSALGRPHGP
jgi:hypothetical protein